MRIFATTVFLVAFVNAAWAESAVFPKNRWFAVDALNGKSLRGKGLTLFVEPEGASSAAFAKGFGGCNDWRSWFDMTGDTEVSFTEFTATERVCATADANREGLFSGSCQGEGVPIGGRDA